jgi:cytochrome c556
MMKLKLIAISSIVAATALTATIVNAQFAKPDVAVKYRKATFTVMGTHFARIGAVAKGEVPFNKEEVAKNAAIVSSMSHLPWQAFGPGTEGGDALPSVWSDNAKFTNLSEKLTAATAALNTAAQSGDLDAVKKAVGAAGQTCKACHDDFKKKG